MSKKIFLFLIIFLIISGFLIFHFRKTEKVEAGATDNVLEWAWSEHIGWISFNNTNTGGSINYGVNINPDGNFTGYAWSEHIGWISFNETDLSGCPVAPCKAWVDLSCPGNQCSVSGWARALAYGDGWDGWIRLRDTNYGVWIESGVAAKPFHGWAWGSDVVGWISFNNSNTGGSIDYKVITSFNFPPYIEMGSQIIEYQEYCNIFVGQGQIGFRWIYKDPDLNPQTRFDFRVNDVNNIDDLNPEVDRSFVGLNNPDGTTNNQAVLVVSPINPDKITYNTTYYWWARVWDNQDKDSGWVSGPSFTTGPHAYPWVDFSWAPQLPSVDEIVQFGDQSTCYDVDDFCNGWSWGFPADWVFEEGYDTSSQNPVGKFTTWGVKNVSLTVIDSDSFYCSTSRNINIKFPLPEWKEIPPL